MYIDIRTRNKKKHVHSYRKNSDLVKMMRHFRLTFFLSLSRARFVKAECNPIGVCDDKLKVIYNPTTMRVRYIADFIWL